MPASSKLLFVARGDLGVTKQFRMLLHPFSGNLLQGPRWFLAGWFDHLDDIKHPYALYPLSGAHHGPWERFYSDIVDDKTIFQHSVEFAFKHLKLIEIHPASELLKQQLDITIDQSKNQLTITLPSVVGFRYFVQSSEDLTSWSTKNSASPMLGSGNFLSYTSQINPSPQSLSK